MNRGSLREGRGTALRPCAIGFDSVEFRAGAAGVQNAQGKADPQSVVAHAIGHALGFDDGDANQAMDETLAAGVRRVLAERVD